MYTFGHKVLVVDTSITTLAAVKTGLVLRGFQVRTTQSSHLSTMVERFKPDMVLLGAGLCRADPHVASAENLCKGSDSRLVIYLHANPTDAEVEALVASCGADGYFTRASDVDALADGIQEVLAERKRSPQ